MYIYNFNKAQQFSMFSFTVCSSVLPSTISFPTKGTNI